MIDHHSSKFLKKVEGCFLHGKAATAFSAS